MNLCWTKPSTWYKHLCMPLQNPSHWCIKYLSFVITSFNEGIELEVYSRSLSRKRSSLKCSTQADLVGYKNACFLLKAPVSILVIKAPPACLLGRLHLFLLRCCCGEEEFRPDLEYPERQKVLPHRHGQNSWLERPHGPHPPSDQRLRLRWVIVHFASDANNCIVVDWGPTVSPLAANYFPEGCAPGANPSSSFCARCVGSKSGIDDGTKCQANVDEMYYGYAGALRSRAQSGCLYKVSSLSLPVHKFCSCCVFRQVSGWRWWWRCLHQTHNHPRKQWQWVVNLFPS